MAFRQGPVEIERFFDVTLGPGSKADVAVSSQPGPAEISCVLNAAVGQHTAWVRAVGGMLDQAGIHVYHTNYSFASPFKVQIGGAASGSLSSFLTYGASTNSWTVQ
jgi:hypothetical protein